MGFLVVTTGRLLLPAELERQALTVAEHRMAGLEGGFDPDVASEVDELSDLAAYAGVALTRDGDWLTISTDLRGDPTWSDQAEEFYRSLSGFVRDGAVNLRAQDGSTWSYQYSPEGVERSSTLAAGEAAGAAPEAPQPDPADPADPAGDSGPGSSHDPPASEPTGPPAPPETTVEPQDFIDYPGRAPRTESSQTSEPPQPSEPSPDPTPAPSPTPYGEQPPASQPRSYRDLGWGGASDDDPPPSPPGRALLMTIVFVVGVLLIIGLALVVAGI